MIEVIKTLIQRYANRGAFVDSNLLLLLIIGTIDENIIAGFKRTQKYTVEDYHALANLLAPFSMLCTTPNVLTEVSNLGNALKSERKSLFFNLLSRHIKTLDERYFPSEQIAHSPEFIKFGLTDSVLIKLSIQGILLVTDDFPLAQYAERAGADVINFNHIRQVTLGQSLSLLTS
jgi:hypothetical protein